MDPNDMLLILFRWLHILAAVAAGGGAIFARTSLLPAAAELPEDARRAVLAGTRTRWSRVVMTAILFLIVSGFYNFFVGPIGKSKPVEEYTGMYHAIFGIKFLLALAVFFLASLLSGRSEAAERFRAQGMKWHTVTMWLVIVIICLSGVLRWIPRQQQPLVEVNVQAAETQQLMP